MNSQISPLIDIIPLNNIFRSYRNSIILHSPEISFHSLAGSQRISASLNNRNSGMSVFYQILRNLISSLSAACLYTVPLYDPTVFFNGNHRNSQVFRKNQMSIRISRNCDQHPVHSICDHILHIFFCFIKVFIKTEK